MGGTWYTCVRQAAKVASLCSYYRTVHLRRLGVSAKRIMSQRDSLPGCNGGIGSGPVLIRKVDSDKDVSDQIRVYDHDGYRLRADAICFRNTSKQEVLLVSSRSWEDQWILPGGGFEPNETMEEAALREAEEEAGVEGKILNYIGSFDNSDNRTRTKVFTIIVTKELDHWRDKEKIGRERRWFTKEEAIAKVRVRRPWKSKWLEEAFASSIDIPTARTNSQTSQPHTISTASIPGCQ